MLSHNLSSRNATGIGFGGASLCADPLGWGWTCWPDSFQQSVLASYNRGTGWSQPETVVTSSALGSPRIASDGFGNLHCVWFDHSGGGSGELRHVRRLGRPGVEDAPNVQVRATNSLPTVVRSVLFLPEEVGGERVAVSGHLLDISGRKVLDLRPGANDVSRLTPGVYFVREAQAQAQAQAVLKVVVTR